MTELAMSRSPAVAVASAGTSNRVAVRTTRCNPPVVSESLRVMLAIGIVVLANCKCWPGQASPVFASDAGGADSHAEIERLDALWKKWQTSIQSVDISGYSFVGATSDPTRPSVRRIDVERMVTESLAPACESGQFQIDAFEGITAPLFSPRPNAEHPERPVGSWRRFRYVESGGARRVDFQLLGRWVTRVRRDGKEETYDEGTAQASLFPTHTNVMMESIQTFAFSPDIAMRRTEWSPGPPDGATSVMESAGLIVHYDSRSGFLRKYVERLPGENYLSDRFQCIPIVSPGAIVIPRVTVVARYFPGSGADAAPLQLLHCYVIESIALNEPIDRSRFVVSVPAGTNVVKFPAAENSLPLPDGVDRPPMQRVAEVAHDISELAEHPEFGKSPANSEADQLDERGWWTPARTVLVAANIVLLLLAIGWWSVRSRRAG